VGVDMSPPEISYEIGKTSTGADTGQLRVVIKDPQSGVDHSQTVVDNLSNEVKPGVPVVNPVARSSIETFAKQVGLYDLIFPTFEPTQQANASGGFSIASVSSDTVLLPALIQFSTISAMNRPGLLAAMKTTHDSPNLSPVLEPIPKFGENQCVLSVYENGKKVNKPSNIELLGLFDFDRRQNSNLDTRDVSVFLKVKNYRKNSMFGDAFLRQKINVFTTNSTDTQRTPLLNRPYDTDANMYAPVGNPQKKKEEAKYRNILFEDSLTDVFYNNSTTESFESPYSSISSSLSTMKPLESIMILSINLSTLPQDNNEPEIYIRIAREKDPKWSTNANGYYVSSQANDGGSWLSLKLKKSTNGQQNWELYACK
jgi:hypothetical protein